MEPKKALLVLIIVSVILLAIAVPIVYQIVYDDITFVIGIGAMVLVVAIIIVVGYRWIKKRFEAGLRQEEENRRKGILKKFTATHIIGLPVAEGVICSIQHLEKKFSIWASSTEFTLDLERVLSIEFKTSTEILAGSPGGAVGGALLFGAIGAIIGGSSTSKTTYYMILTYKKEEDIKYITFEISPLLNFELQKHFANFNIEQAGSAQPNSVEL